MILSRPARLLECLEFDPSSFYVQLEVEEQVLNQKKVSVDIEEYIKSKLGLEDVFSDNNERENTEGKQTQRKVSCLFLKVNFLLLFLKMSYCFYILLVIIVNIWVLFYGRNLSFL